MAKYLATFSDSLDDIELNGFAIMTDKELERYEELASSITWSFDFEMGYEKIPFESGEDLLTRIDFKEISNEEFKVLKKIFGLSFGTFIKEEYLELIVSEDDDNDDDFDDMDFDGNDDDDFDDIGYNSRKKGRNHNDYDDEYEDDY